MKPRTIAIAVVVALIAVGALALAFLPKGSTMPASGNVTNAGVRDLVAKGARLIDVRTAAEFEAGHIPDAENVPIEGLPAAAGVWDKAAPLVVYCATGARSANASAYLKAQGFTHVYNLTAGVAAWDGELATGASSSSASAGTAGPATGRPTLYDFYTDG
jgi:phage shock protein E